MPAMIRPAATLLLFMTLLTGIAYPITMCGLGAMLFTGQAQGSPLYWGGRTMGSRLIGQNFSDPRYFWGRPSATTPQPYNALASGGSNLGPLNAALTTAVTERIAALRAADPGNTAAVPVDLVTASGSGLDPEISLAAANYQADRIARLRGLDPGRVRALIRAKSRGKFLGVLGEPRVNVLELNLVLDLLKS
ncbi:MAG: potassium-transporting ATPase subunit KdpC [Proteobacteria bacterium]|nr:potassium-transporting ATPase subunit KdpC [Pseudomonadota bacterium]